MLISTLNKTYLLFVLQTVTSQTKIFLSVLVYNMNTIMLKREVTKLGPSTIKKRQYEPFIIHEFDCLFLV
jgi:hypothetical protein